MRVRLPRRRVVLGLLAAALAVLGTGSCGGGTDSPTAPTRNATLALSAFTVGVERLASGGYTYRVSFTIAESSGQSAATVTTIRFAFPNGASATADPSSPLRIAAGQSYPTGMITINDREGVTEGTASVTVAVGFSDESGHSSSASSVATFAQPAPARFFTLVGTVIDAGTVRPVVGATVRAVDARGASLTASTDGNGYYSLVPLVEGAVNLTVTAGGYQTASRSTTLTQDSSLTILIQPTQSTPGGGCASPPGSADCGRPTARCNDGSWSCSQNRSGTCSSHGGVSCWVCPGPLC